jgi:hypothetical protein
LPLYTIKILPKIFTRFHQHRISKRCELIHHFNSCLKTILQNIGYSFVSCYGFFLTLILCNDLLVFQWLSLDFINYVECTWISCLFASTSCKFALIWLNQFALKYLIIWSWYIVSKNAYNMMNGIWVTL